MSLAAKKRQPGLFDEKSAQPEGFRYGRDIISIGEETALVNEFQNLPFKEFEFHGFLGKRRIVSFGWKYDYGERRIQRSQEIPGFLLAARESAARFAGMAAADFQQVLVTEYRPGAAIGWHRDKREFGEVIGLSLLSPCTFRFRRKSGANWQRITMTVEPRSVYLLQGPARSEWEHSIPGVGELRYSITFRNLSKRSQAAA